MNTRMEHATAEQKNRALATQSQLAGENVGDGGNETIKICE